MFNYSSLDICTGTQLYHLTTSSLPRYRSACDLLWIAVNTYQVEQIIRLIHDDLVFHFIHTSSLSDLHITSFKSSQVPQVSTTFLQ